jgi:hypothetical protein
MIDAKVIWETGHMDVDEKMHIEGKTSNICLELEKIIYRIYEYVWLTDREHLANVKRDFLYQVDAQYGLFMKEVRRCEEYGTTDKLIKTIEKRTNHEGWLTYGKN